MAAFVPGKPEVVPPSLQQPGRWNETALCERCDSTFERPVGARRRECGRCLAGLRGTFSRPLRAASA
jgi:hypothetical protein